MSTQTLDRTDIDPATGQARVSHLIGPRDGKDGAMQAMEARFNGTEVEALCGHRWIPQHDPKQYPVCQRCLDIFRENTGKSDDWELS
jgi:hypothetical protein